MCWVGGFDGRKSLLAGFGAEVTVTLAMHRCLTSADVDD